VFEGEGLIVFFLANALEILKFAHDSFPKVIDQQIIGRF
jgi:hypothetical protein